MNASSWRNPLPWSARITNTPIPVISAEVNMGIPVSRVIPIAAPRTSARSVAIAVISWVIQRT